MQIYDSGKLYVSRRSPDGVRTFDNHFIRGNGLVVSLRPNVIAVVGYHCEWNKALKSQLF